MDSGKRSWKKIRNARNVDVKINGKDRKKGILKETWRYSMEGDGNEGGFN